MSWNVQRVSSGLSTLVQHISRSSRRVDVGKMKEFMGSLIGSVVMIWVRMASMAAMVASMASMVLMAPRATMEIASAALKASKAEAPVLRWSKLRNKLLVHQQPSYENSPKIWMGSTSTMAEEDDGPTCSRRVDNAKMKLSVVSFGWWRRMVASMDGVDGWLRWLASMEVSNGGVDGWRRWWTGLRHRGH